MLGYALHVEEAEKISLDYMDVEALKDLQVWLAGISPPLGSTKVSARAVRFLCSLLGSSPAPSHWPCTYWPTQSSRACIRANPCV
ncbi:hypothetical protein ACOSP7_026908 [Xanthoceras sorbifolium]